MVPSHPQWAAPVDAEKIRHVNTISQDKFLNLRDHQESYPAGGA